MPNRWVSQGGNVPPLKIPKIPQNFRAFGAILLLFLPLFGKMCNVFTSETIVLVLVFHFFATAAHFCNKTFLFTSVLCPWMKYDRISAAYQSEFDSFCAWLCVESTVAARKYDKPKPHRANIFVKTFCACVETTIAACKFEKCLSRWCSHGVWSKNWTLLRV